MALTDTFVRLVKPGRPGGEKHTGGAGMYLLVKETGKYWRMNCRFLGKRKTLALGVYPEVSLATARKWRDEARKLLTEGIDPSQAKRDDRNARTAAAEQTLEVVANHWLAKIAPTRSASTQEKVKGWLEKNVFPVIGKKPIADIKPRDVLAAVQKMEKRGAVESAHRVKQVCGQIFRFAVALDLVERDITAGLRGALAPTVKGNFAAITEPKQVGALMRAIYDYHGFPRSSGSSEPCPRSSPSIKRFMWHRIDEILAQRLQEQFRLPAAYVFTRPGPEADIRRVRDCRFCQYCFLAVQKKASLCFN